MQVGFYGKDMNTNVCAASLQRFASWGGDHSDSAPQQNQWWILHLLQRPMETLHEERGVFYLQTEL